MARSSTQELTEILKAFLVLGLTAFGGPVAHLGYFRAEFVERRAWLTEEDYADLVALCQFLPGPASSQVGFAVGLQRAGLVGALVAWAAFTLPSALLLIAFAYSASALAGDFGKGLVHGLKVMAVAVVAQAVWGMARSLCPDRERAAIAVTAVVVLALWSHAFVQVAVIALGATAGLFVCRCLPGKPVGQLQFHLSTRFATGCLVVFLLLLVGLPLLVELSGVQGVAVFEAFYRAGALVFGGGHVVLPLLEASTVESGWVSSDTFLAGYGATQAVPGPLFTFAAYLGAVLRVEPNGVLGASLCLTAVFLPGLLLVLGILPFWDRLRRRSLVQQAMAGANAAVVGVLGSALYSPVWTSGVHSAQDFALALTAFILLTVWKAAPWKVVLFTAVSSAVLGALFG